MGPNFGAWKTALIDPENRPLIPPAIEAGPEFTGDDLDRYSGLVDLGGDYEFIGVYIPTIDSAVITPYVQRDNKVDMVTPANGTVPAPVVALDAAATGHFAHATSAGTGLIFVVFRIGGFQYVRLHSSVDQGEAGNFYVRGFNRG